MNVRIEVSSEEDIRTIQDYLSEEYRISDTDFDILIIDRRSLEKNKEEIKHLKKDTFFPILLVAEKDDSELNDMHLCSIFDEIIFRPFSRTELLTRVRNLSKMKEMYSKIKERNPSPQAGILFPEIEHPLSVINPEYEILYEFNTLLHDIEKGVLSSESLKEILSMTARKLIEILPVEIVAIIVFKDDKIKELTCESKEGVKPICNWTFPYEKTEEIKKTLEKGDPYTITSMDMESLKEMYPSDSGFESCTFIPVLSENFPGAICIFSSGKDALTDKVIRLTMEIADSLALAINSLIMRQELTESEEMFRALAEKSLVGVDIIQDGVFVYVNPKFAEMIDYSREGLMGKSPLDFIHPDDRDIFAKNYRERIEGRRKEIHYTLRAVRKDGEIRYIETYGSRIMLKGKPAIVGVSIDITDRMRMQEELKKYAENLELMVEERTKQLAESETRYRSLVELPIIGFWEADSDGVFRFVNERFIEMMEYHRNEIVGKKSIIDLVAPHHRSWINRRAELLKQKRLPADVLEVELVKKDGSTLHVLVSPCPIYDEKETHIRTVGAMIDITDRVKMEKKLIEALDELKAYTKAISHDLRSPLRGLMGYAEALVDEYPDRLDDEGRKYLNRILYLSAKMDSLINDLLNYTKVSEIEKTVERVDMNEIVDYAVDMLGDEIRGSGAEIIISDLPEVKGDRKLLLSVMMNLISNAIKFVKKGVVPEVRIYSEDRGKYVRICTEDNGIGVPEEHRERIFHLFERLHGEEIYPGTGVGLATVKKSVELMEGKYGVDSGDDGSIFWIEIESW